VQITIYSTTTCPYCKLLKDYLTSKNISFTEKLIDQEDGAQAEMAGVSGGFMGVPFTSIVKDGGEKVSILGFDKGKIQTVLGV
jgi:glutaredoxin 3